MPRKAPFHVARDAVKKLLRSKLLWGGALSLFIQFQFQIIRLISGVILARILGPRQLGIYSFTMSLVQLIQVVPVFGVANVVMRYSAVYRMRAAWEFLRGLRITAHLVSIGYGVVTAGGILLLIHLGWLTSTAAVSPTALEIGAILLISRPILSYLGAVLRVENPGVIGQLPKYVVQPWLFLLFVILVALAARSCVSADSAVLAQGITAVATAVFALPWVARISRKSAQVAQRRYEFANWFRSASSFWLLGGLELICTQADMLLLGTFGTAREAGIYRVATNGSNLLLLCATAVDLYLGPKIPELYARLEKAKLERLLSLVAKGAFIASLALSCLFWFWGREILRHVFGAAYSAAFWPLAILCGGQLAYVASGASGLLLGMTGHERECVLIAGISAVCNVALNVALIPRLGAIGSAVATGIAMVVWSGLLVRAVKRRLGVGASIFA